MNRIYGILSFLALTLIAAVFLAATASWAGSGPGPRASYDDAPLLMLGKGQATQIGKHDAKNRFCYDGSCVMSGVGSISIKLDPDKQTGRIVANFDGPDGKWKIVAEKFKLVKTDVDLHGATGGDVDKSMSPPVLPQVWTYVATWGPGTVWHNGEKVWTGPTHLMVTEEVRDPATGKVDYKGPKMVKEYAGSVHNKYGVQVHLVSHPDEEPTKGYLPPFTKFVHLMWERVVWE